MIPPRFLLFAFILSSVICFLVWLFYFNMEKIRIKVNQWRSKQKKKVEEDLTQYSREELEQMRKKARKEGKEKIGLDGYN